MSGGGAVPKAKEQHRPPFGRHVPSGVAASGRVDHG